MGDEPPKHLGPQDPRILALGLEPLQERGVTRRVEPVEQHLRKALRHLLELGHVRERLGVQFRVDLVQVDPDPGGIEAHPLTVGETPAPVLPLLTDPRLRQITGPEYTALNRVPRD